MKIFIGIVIGIVISIGVISLLAIIFPGKGWNEPE